MLSKKTLNLLTVLYILFLGFGFFYVRDIVTTEKIDVEDKAIEEQVEEIKPVIVYLQVDDGKNVSNYKAKLYTVNNFEDLLNYLRKNGELKYEKIWYTYGTEIYDVNGIRANDVKKWKIYENDMYVTVALEDLKLIDGTIYKLVFN